MKAQQQMLIQKRKQMDITKLVMSNYKVEMNDTQAYNFFVELPGPQGSLYEGANFKINVDLPDTYPYKSPSVGFITRIFHPNVDERSGSVCLDNVFDTFLPQLLLYPNPNDPLNGEAAALMLKDYEKYKKRVQELLQKYAVVVKEEKQVEELSDISREGLSELSETSDLEEVYFD